MKIWMMWVRVVSSEGVAALAGTHGDANFVHRNVLPGDTSSIQSEPLRIHWEFFVLPGDTTSANPTLEPCSEEGIFLHHQIGKSSIRKYNRGTTMTTPSILQ